MTDRHTQGFDFDRHKGFRIGTLWCSNSDVDGDITLSSNFDGLDHVAKIDLLHDFIGLLEREIECLENSEETDHEPSLERERT